MRLYAINEFNLITYAIRRACGEPALILYIAPLLPPAEGLLRRAVEALVKHGGAAWARDTLTELRLFEKNPAEIEYAHIYPQFEQDFRSHYRFDDLQLGDYLHAYKHTASSWLKFHLGRLPYLKELLDRSDAREIKLVGLPEELHVLFRIVYGRPLPGRMSRIGLIQILLNFVSSLAVVTSAIFAVLQRLTARLPQATPHTLGADLASEDVREFFLRIEDRPGEILFVPRNAEVETDLDPDAVSRYPHASLRDGRITMATAGSAIGSAFVDSLMLLGQLWWLPSALYFNAAKLVRTRLIYRAFFACHPMTAFFARDEYNADHVIRTQELRRAGIHSIGITHGMSTGPRVYPHTRYLDYDRLYVFGKRQHEAYAETWPSKMEVRAIGAFRPTREQWAGFQGPRTRDIVIFGNQDTDPPEHVAVTRRIAAAFPDRTVIIKLKYMRAYIGADRYDRYMELLGELPKNVILANDRRPYDIMRTPTYSFSGLSTVVAEAYQFGMTSFFIDTYLPEMDVFFRDFPDLCVGDADEAIHRVREIEAGNWVYPRDRFADLIETGGADPYDVMRADLGLPPLGQPPSATMEKIA